MQRIDFVRVLKRYDWEPVRKSGGGRRGKGAHETFQNIVNGRRMGFSLHDRKEIGVPLLKDLCKRFDIPFEEAFTKMTGTPPGFKELSLYNEPQDTLGRLIYESRRNKDMARSSLAKLLATDVTTIAAWEKNESIPRDEQLIQLASYFQWSENDMRLIKSVGQQLTTLWADQTGSEPAESVAQIVVTDPPNKMVAAPPAPAKSKSGDIDISKLRYRDVESWLRDRMQLLQTYARRLSDIDSREESMRGEVSALRSKNQELDASNNKLNLENKDLKKANNGLTGEIERLNRQAEELKNATQEAREQAATPRQVVALTDEEKAQITEWRRKAIMYDNLQRSGLA